MSRSWIDAFLGRLLDNGTELELIGGLNFVGFTITPDTANGYYTITNPASATLPAGADDSLQRKASGTAFGTTAWIAQLAGGIYAGMLVASDNAYLALGATPATSGGLRMGNTLEVRFAGAGALAGTSLRGLGLGADNVIRIGDTNAVEVDINSAGNVDFNNGAAGALNYRFGQTLADLMNKPLDGIASLRQNGTEASSGFIRLINNAGSVMMYRSYAGNARSIISTTGDGSTFDDVLIGDSNATDGNTTLYLNAKTQAIFNFSASNQYVFNSTEALWGSNGLIQIGYAGFGGGTTASTGYQRFANNDTGAMYMRTNGGSNCRIIGHLDTSDRLHTGDSTNLDTWFVNVKSGGSFSIWVAGAEEWTFSGTQLDAKLNNIVNLVSLNGARYIAPTQGANLGDTNETINISGGANYYMPASTTTTARTKTIGNTGVGAAPNDAGIVSVTVMTQGHNVVFNNNSAAAIYTLTASSSARVLDFQYDHATTNYVFRGWKPVQ
jgi:hypothetical protein